MIAVLVYDITRLKTFQSVATWVEELHHNVEDVSILIVGNKTDLDERREVTEEYLNEYKGEQDSSVFGYLECSALTGDNINKIFELVADQLIKMNSKN